MRLNINKTRHFRSTWDLRIMKIQYKMPYIKLKLNKNSQNKYFFFIIATFLNVITNLSIIIKCALKKWQN